MAYNVKIILNNSIAATGSSTLQICMVIECEIYGELSLFEHKSVIKFRNCLRNLLFWQLIADTRIDDAS